MLNLLKTDGSFLKDNYDDILLGGSYRQKGEKDKALEYFQKALAIDLVLM